MEHELKTMPAFFEAVLSGEKTAEVRKNDRSFQKGDKLLLREYEIRRTFIGGVLRPEYSHFEADGYSERKARVVITHVLTGEEWGIKDGYAVLSFKKIKG